MIQVIFRSWKKNFFFYYDKFKLSLKIHLVAAFKWLNPWNYFTFRKNSHQPLAFLLSDFFLRHFFGFLQAFNAEAKPSFAPHAKLKFHVGLLHRLMSEKTFVCVCVLRWIGLQLFINFYKSLNQPLNRKTPFQTKTFHKRLIKLIKK